MGISKTKDRIVDVARQLFARDGIENTTMNDIALASKKGRRTLYTYFKNKDEVYMAVVKSELDNLLDHLIEVSKKDISPDEKLLEIVLRRLEAIKEVVFRNGTLRANFFRDIWKVEQVRKKFDRKEISLLKTIIQEGADKGVFEIDDVEMTAGIVHYCLRGIEVPFIRGQIGANVDPACRHEYIANIVFGGLRRSNQNINK